jgi:hypothetical protein
MLIYSFDIKQIINNEYVPQKQSDILRSSFGMFMAVYSMKKVIGQVIVFCVMTICLPT